MNNSSPFVIQTTGLSKTYKGVRALPPLELQVQEHSICCFLIPKATPIIAIALWCVLFTGVAIWRFRREEF